MKENIKHALKSLASLSFGLGLFQFLNSLNVFYFLKGNLMYFPAGIIILFSFIFIFKVISKIQKFQTIILIFIIIFGLGAASFFGHKSTINELKKSGVKVIQ